MEITGILKHKGAVKLIGEDLNIQSIFLDISENGKENYAELQLFGADKVALALDIQIGDKIKCDFNLKGRSYEKKDNTGKGFFQTLNIWRITKIKEETVGLPAPIPAGLDSDDDLPF